MTEDEAGMEKKDSAFVRTEMLYGPEKMARLASCRVAVFGIGGVGGYVVEALARSGIGAIDLIDYDRIENSNLNRQIIATKKNLGQYKTQAAASRIHDIAPECKVRTWQTFFLPDTRDLFHFEEYDYVADAIDTVTGKLLIIECAKEAGVPVISCMGTGNKINPCALEVADIYSTSVCPLARVMRRECRKRGIESLKVVYSREKPIHPADPTISASPSGTAEESFTVLPSAAGPELEGPSGRRSVPGSVAFVPSVAGLIIAGEIINSLAGMER